MRSKHVLKTGFLTHDAAPTRLISFLPTLGRIEVWLPFIAIIQCKKAATPEKVSDLVAGPPLKQAIRF